MLRCGIRNKCLETLYYLKMIQICVNGSTKAYEQPLAVAELLQDMALAGRKVAVERNGEIVPRGAHASTLLTDGDRLEIVAAVGGG
jgi:sulfur carrier protein